jgi:hypothetical protein
MSEESPKSAKNAKIPIKITIGEVSTIYPSMYLASKAVGVSTTLLRKKLNGDVMKSNKLDEIGVAVASAEEIPPKEKSKGWTCDVCHKSFKSPCQELHEKSKKHQKKLLPSKTEGDQ